MKTLFAKHHKILIGVVHLQPLPGSPRWRGDMESVIEFAVNDARAYERGGAHAVFIENFGDVPFTKGNVAPETLAAMAAAGCAIRQAVESRSDSTSCATTPAPRWPCALSVAARSSVSTSTPARCSPIRD